MKSFSAKQRNVFLSLLPVFICFLFIILFGCKLEASAENGVLQKLAEDAETTDIRENREIGFGAKRIYFQNRGYWVTGIEFENSIIGLEVRCPGSGPDTPVEPIIRKAIKNAGLPPSDQNLCYYTYKDEAEFTRWQSVIERNLGKSESIRPDKKTADYYENLSSPFAFHQVGWQCGYSGSKPSGLVMIEELVKANQIDILRSLLKSRNPEGRVYAAIGLKMIAKKHPKKLSALDIKAIEKIKDLPILIESCNGCLPETSTARQLIDTIESINK